MKAAAIPLIPIGLFTQPKPRPQPTLKCPILGIHNKNKTPPKPKTQGPKNQPKSPKKPTQQYKRRAAPHRKKK